MRVVMRDGKAVKVAGTNRTKGVGVKSAQGSGWVVDSSARVRTRAEAWQNLAILPSAF